MKFLTVPRLTIEMFLSVLSTLVPTLLVVLLGICFVALVGCSSVTRVGKFTWSMTIEEPESMAIPDNPDAGDVPAE